MSDASIPTNTHAPRSTTLHLSLWAVQALLGVLFIATGVWKLLTPVPKLAAMIPWAGQVPEGFLQATVELALKRHDLGADFLTYLKGLKL